MKNSPLATILLVLLVIGTLGSLVLCWSYISNSRELRGLQKQAAMVNNNRALINALVTDMLEYSKKNSAIDPVLESIQGPPGWPAQWRKSRAAEPGQEPAGAKPKSALTK
jgi:hypothetical protein